MALSLNTSHALYSNLVSLIAVDGGALVDLKTARTFTKDAAASYGTGTYGAHFRTSTAGGYTAQGASFTPAVHTNPSTTAYTVLAVLNAAAGKGGGDGLLLGSTAGDTYFINMVLGNDYAGVGRGFGPFTHGTTSDITGTGAHTLFATKPAGDNQTIQLYVDNVADASQSSGFTSTIADFDYIGGYPGQGSVAGDIVYVVVFNKVLNSTERGDLIASLGAGNTFGLLTAAPATGITLTGPSTGPAGSPSSNFTVGVTPVGGTITGTVVVTPAATGCTFSPSTVSLTTAAPTATFTCTAAASGAKTISTTNNGSLTNPSTLTYTASSTATATVVSGPSTGVTGAASANFTASANGTITGTVVITPTAAGCTFSPSTVSISSGTPTATFTCTPASAGAKTISFANNGGLTNQANLTYTATAAAVTGVTMTGPATGPIGTASSVFTLGVTPVGGTITGTVTVTPSDSSGGGIFSPTTASLNAGTPTATFTYTAASAGAKTISVTNNGSLTNPSNITYTASAASCSFNFVAPDHVLGRSDSGALRTGLSTHVLIEDATTGALLATKTGQSTHATTALPSNFTVTGFGPGSYWITIINDADNDDRAYFKMTAV